MKFSSPGAQAIALAATRRPDIVLLDLGLADMDGEEAIAAIKGGSLSAALCGRLHRLLEPRAPSACRWVRRIRPEAEP
jgi:CheY-like chemotaxis protein